MTVHTPESEPYVTLHRRSAGRVGLADPPSVALDSPGSMKVSCLLMQDTVSGSLVSAGPGTRPGSLAGKTALFANPYRDGKEEALVVDESGHLTYLQRANTDTGWIQSPVTGGGTSVLVAGEVVVVIHPQDLTVWAIYTPGATGVPQALQLVTNTMDGVTACHWESRPGQIYPMSEGLITGLSHLYTYYEGRYPRVTAYDPGTGCVVGITAPVGMGVRFYSNVYPVSFLKSGPLEDLVAGRIRTSPMPTTYLRFGSQIVRYDGTDPMVVTRDATQLVGVYYAWGKPDIGCLYLDTAGNLVAWNQASEHPSVSNTTPDLGFVTATSWIDVNQMLHVYGLDAKNTLKVVHQASIGRHGLPIWSRSKVVDPPPPSWRGEDETVVSCVGLVPKVAAFAVDPFPDYQPNELVKSEGTATPGERFSFYAQDINSARWSRDKVRLPANGDPHLVTHYVSSVTVLDKRGAPMPGLTVQVSAESLAEIQVDGASYLVGPGHGAALATNAFGKITIATPADSLLPATLHVDATGLANGAVIQPASMVHEYLAGSGTLPSQKGLFSVTALQDATVDGVHIVDKDHQAGIPHAVDGTHQLFKKSAGKPLTSRHFQGSGPAPHIHGFSVGSGPIHHVDELHTAVYREFATPAAADEHLAAIRALPNYGGIWEDFAAWAGDVWEGIKNGVIKVYDVVVTTVTKVFVWIGDKIIQLAEFIVDTVATAVRAVEAVFSKVVAAVSKVVDWLKALFDFKDIWNTKTALEKGFGTVVSYGVSTVEHYGDVAHGWFVAQEELVKVTFAELKVRYAGRPLGDGGNQVPAVTDASGHVVAPSDLRSNPQVTWMLDQAVGTRAIAAAAPHALAYTPDPAVVDAFDVFLAKVEATGIVGSFTSILGDIQTILAQVVDPADPELAAKASMTALIDIVEKLVLVTLQALDALVGAIVTFVTAMAAGVQAFLDTPLPLGPINTLFKWIQEQAGLPGTPVDMTIGGLVFLIGGFGITTLYKLVNGVDQAPFPGGVFPEIPAPPWHADYDATANVADFNSRAKFVQAIAGFSGIIGVIPEVVGDLLPLARPPQPPPPAPPIPNPFFRGEQILASVAVIFNSAMCGALGSIPVINGNPWDEPADPWGVACAIQSVYALAGLGAILTFKATSDSGGGFLKNARGVALGPALAGLASGSTLITSCIAASRSGSNAYSVAQLSVSAVPGLAQFFRIKIPGVVVDPSFPTRVAVVAAIDGVSLVVASGLTIGAALSAGPAILSGPKLPDAKVGVPYRVALQASGGTAPYNQPLQDWKVSGELPAGLTFAAGVVSGTPTVPGTKSFSVTVRDSYGPPQTSEPAALSITVT